MHKYSIVVIFVIFIFVSISLLYSKPIWNMFAGTLGISNVSSENADQREDGAFSDGNVPEHQETHEDQYIIEEGYKTHAFHVPVASGVEKISFVDFSVEAPDSWEFQRSDVGTSVHTPVLLGSFEVDGRINANRNGYLFGDVSITYLPPLSFSDIFDDREYDNYHAETIDGRMVDIFSGVKSSSDHLLFYVVPITGGAVMLERPADTQDTAFEESFLRMIRSLREVSLTRYVDETQKILFGFPPKYITERLVSQKVPSAYEPTSVIVIENTDTEASSFTDDYGNTFATRHFPEMIISVFKNPLYGKDFDTYDPPEERELALFMLELLLGDLFVPGMTDKEAQTLLRENVTTWGLGGSRFAARVSTTDDYAVSGNYVILPVYLSEDKYFYHIRYNGSQASFDNDRTRMFIESIVTTFRSGSDFFLQG